MEREEELEYKYFVNEAMLKNVPGGYYRCSSEQGYPFTYVTERFLDILGWTEKELQDKFDSCFINLLHVDDQKLVDDYVNRISAPENKQKYQEQIYRLSGKNGYRWVVDTTMQMDINGKTFYQGFISDITRFIEEIEKNKRELERLEYEKKQNDILIALGRNYHVILHIDLENDTYEQIFCREDVEHYYRYNESKASKLLQLMCEKNVDEKYKPQMRRFFNFDTIKERLRDSDFVEAEFITNKRKWHRVKIIARKRDENGKVTNVLYVTEIIDDEKQFEAHLVAKAEHAEYANRSKTDFISQVVHDIRTPMNSIFGFLEIAEANINNADKVKYTLGKIRVAGEFLKDLANDVLDITRMEDGRLTLHPVEFSLSEMFDEFIVSIQNAKFGKEQIFHSNIHDIMHDQIVADSLRLKQIYTNVATNSIKYTPNGGVIQLEVYQEETGRDGYVRVVVIITDTGMGMSEEFMEKMFSKFERETDTRINKISGYGLGLPIVKQLVDIMQGEINVKSKLGEGTEFCIKLELPYTQQIDKHEADASEEYDADVCAGMNILVAEDNELNREVITELLAMYNITCECAEDGNVCVSRFKESDKGTYDAILMDMQMPLLNGIEATKQIRALPLPWAKTIPIIAMTANAMKDDVQKCLEAGMNRHLSKPVDIKQILKTLIELNKI